MEVELAETRVETIGSRLRDVRGKRTRKEFAGLLGIHENTLGGYERDERQPEWSFVLKLRDMLGVDVNALIDGESVPRGEFSEGQSPFARPDADAIVTLPRYEIRAAAGRGALVVSENVAEYMAVGRDWLQRNLPPWAPPNAVVGVLEGSGDSMEPTIRDGDLIMLVRDPDWRVVERGGVFVLTIDHDRLLLKRLQIMMNGDLAIISDNKAYADETLPKNELQDRVIIHGQVFFVGGKPRSFAG